MAQESAKNASGATFNFELPNANGRQNAAGSRPVAVDSETKAVLDAQATSAKQDLLLTEVQSVNKAEDAAHSSGDKGVMALVVRKDTAAALAGADGDYAPLEVDASGRLWVNIGAMIALPAGTNNIGDVDVLTLPSIPAGTNNIGDVDIVGGTIAHDAADSGNPVKIGAVARTSTPGAVAAGDRVDLSADVYGSLRVVQTDTSGAIVDPLATVNVAPDTAVVKNGSTSLTPKFAAISSTGSGDTLALVSGKKIRVLSMFFVLAGASTVKFQTGATTDLTGAMSFAANGGISLPFNPNGWFETAAGAKLNHVLGSSVGIAGGFLYIEV